MSFRGTPPISGLPEIGINDAQVGNSRPAWHEPGIQTQGLWVFLDSGRRFRGAPE